MPLMSTHNNTRLPAGPLQNLEANFKASIIRHWTDFEAIANRYGCSLEVTNGLRLHSEEEILAKHGPDIKIVRKHIDTKHNNYIRGLAVGLGVTRTNGDNPMEDVEFDLVETICREIASAWKDEAIKWGGPFGDPLYFEWTARDRRYEPPLTKNRQPIPQPPALGPLPTPWKSFVALLKRLLHMKSMY